MSSHCEHCGSNTYFARNFPRVRDEADYLRRELNKKMVRIAQLELELSLRDHRERTDAAWLRGKVVAQARELKRLNDKRNSERVMAGQEPLPDVTDVDTITATEVDHPARPRTESS